MALESLDSKRENDRLYKVVVYVINFRFSETGTKNMTKSLSLFDIYILGKIKTIKSISYKVKMKDP